VTAALLLGLRLALGGGRAQRLRAASVAAAVLVGTVVLLGTAAIAHSEGIQHLELYANADNRRLLAAVVTAVGFPVLILAATVGRLSAGLRDRRMANLRLLGLGRAQVRFVAASETGVAALTGALLGVPGFLLVRPLLASARVAGRGWPAPTLWPPLWAYVVVVLALPAVVIAVAALPQRLHTAAALASARRADTSRPTWWRLLPLLLGALLCGYVITADLTHGLPGTVVLALFAGITLLGLGMVVATPVFVRLLADLTLRLTRRPTLRIAARRLQAQPAAVNRVISGLLVGLFVVVGARSVLVAFEGTPQYREAAYQIERGQSVAGIVTASQAPGVVQRMGHARPVRRVLSLPTLASACTDRDPARGCIRAVVASCAQLHLLDPDLRGCLPGRAMVLSNTWGPGSSTTGLLPLHATHDGNPVASSPPVRIPPATTARGDVGRAPDGILGWRLWNLDAQIVLPPGATGVDAAVALTDRTVMVLGEPGRGLADELAAAGVDQLSAPDFANYDFVAQLRALLWAVAAVVLGIGLLAFAVAAVDRAVARRREVTALQLVGVPRSMLRRTQWAEAAVPLALGSTLAIALGLLAGATYLSLDDESHLSSPWAPALRLVLIAAVGSLLVGALTVVASSPRISPDLIRHE
jgi:putative ABC transport system permease protein